MNGYKIYAGTIGYLNDWWNSKNYRYATLVLNPKTKTIGYYNTFWKQGTYDEDGAIYIGWRDIEYRFMDTDFLHKHIGRAQLLKIAQAFLN